MTSSSATYAICNYSSSHTYGCVHSISKNRLVLLQASKRVRTSKAAGVDARQVADLDAMNGGEIGEHDLEHHEGEGWKKTKTGLLAEVEDI